MKITDIRTVHLGAPADERSHLDRNWTFVLVDTDTDIQGVGECTLHRMSRAASEAVDQLKSLLIGQDPRRVEHLWQQMYRHPFWRGGIVLSAALSGIDQALWDIAGKSAGMPVYRLLGGPVRDRIWCYARPDGAQTHVEQAIKAKEQGFTAFKFGPGEPSGPMTDDILVKSAVSSAGEIRAAVGPDMRLMIDFHGRLSPIGATKVLEALRPYDLFFVEELIPPDHVDAYRDITHSIPGMTYATGERLYTRWGFRQLIESRAVQIIQPDLAYAGGISEVRRIAAHAETHYLSVAPHNPNGPVATAASIHIAAATPNFLILEYARKAPYFEEVLRDPLVVRDGHFELPERPGLGVELDEDFLSRHPYHHVPYGPAWDPYGAVADV